MVQYKLMIDWLIDLIDWLIDLCVGGLGRSVGRSIDWSCNKLLLNCATVPGLYGWLYEHTLKKKKKKKTISFTTF